MLTPDQLSTLKECIFETRINDCKRVLIWINYLWLEDFIEIEPVGIFLKNRPLPTTLTENYIIINDATELLHFLELDYSDIETEFHTIPNT